MTKKKTPQTIEECSAELERTQKLLQQYENRNKMLNGYTINKGRFFTFFCRRLATTLQGIVCRCWVICYRENPRAN